MAHEFPHQGSTKASRSDDYNTPKEVIDAVHEFFNGPPDLDPASTSEANAIVGARNYITEQTNGLVALWYGNIFLNPPFSKKVDFLEKLNFEIGEERTEQALVIVPITLSTRFWQTHIADRPFCAWHKRVNYSGQKGCTFETAVVYFGPDVWRFRDVFKDYGTVYTPFR